MQGNNQLENGRTIANNRYDVRLPLVFLRISASVIGIFINALQKIIMTKKLLFAIFTLILLVLKLNGQTFLIFGGKSHDVFLGCLNCDKYYEKSI